MRLNLGDRVVLSAPIDIGLHIGPCGTVVFYSHLRGDPKIDVWFDGAIGPTRLPGDAVRVIPKQSASEGKR